MDFFLKVTSEKDNEIMQLNKVISNFDLDKKGCKYDLNKY